MIVFIGLGNVGEKYKETKHNAGFWIMDEMAARHKISFSPGVGDYVIASKLDKKKGKSIERKYKKKCKKEKNCISL